MKYIAIGDIHGHYDKLMSLMERLKDEVDFDKDTFVFLGDYVDGGYDTRKVISKLIFWKGKYPHWKFLYGNHEDLMLDALDPLHPVYHDFYLWWNQGGRETTKSYTLAMKGLNEYERSLVTPIDAIPRSHVDFIRNLDTYYETDNYFFVHGGVHEYRSLEWSKKNMSRYDMIWKREPFIKSKKDWGKKIIFGHTIRISRNPKNHLTPWVFPNKIGIDTMAHNVGHLTAVILPEEKFVTS